MWRGVGRVGCGFALGSLLLCLTVFYTSSISYRVRQVYTGGLLVFTPAFYTPSISYRTRQVYTGGLLVFTPVFYTHSNFIPRQVYTGRWSTRVYMAGHTRARRLRGIPQKGVRSGLPSPYYCGIRVLQSRPTDRPNMIKHTEGGYRLRTVLRITQRRRRDMIMT